MTPTYYERHLPHWHPPGGTFFITYRLKGSVPKHIIHEIRETTEQELAAVKRVCQDPSLLPGEIRRLQIRYFVLYEQALDTNLNEPYWLKIPEIGQEIFDSLLFIGKEEADVWAFCIMPNHVHVLLTHKLQQRPLYKLLQSHKGFTARQCNKILGRTGAFWQDESYDHVVRKDGEFERIVQYILQNPVKAGMVKNWTDWPLTFLHPSIQL
ncbi:MAG: transposase [Lewinellaceae bacterium]|nr:transposase [Lewinellaceae bacterium]